MLTDIKVDETANVEELLSRGTYQGMTDGEIQAIFQYKLRNACFSDDNITAIASKIENANLRIEKMRMYCNSRVPMIESIANAQMSL